MFGDIGLYIYIFLISGHPTLGHSVFLIKERRELVVLACSLLSAVLEAKNALERSLCAGGPDRGTLVEFTGTSSVTPDASIRVCVRLKCHKV